MSGSSAWTAIARSWTVSHFSWMSATSASCRRRSHPSSASIARHYCGIIASKEPDCPQQPLGGPLMQKLSWWRPAGARLSIHIQIQNRKKHPSFHRLGRQSVAWWRRGRDGLQQPVSLRQLYRAGLRSRRGDTQIYIGVPKPERRTCGRRFWDFWGWSHGKRRQSVGPAKPLHGVLKTGCAEGRSPFAGCPRVSLRHNYIANLSKVGPPVRFTGALLTDARS